MVETRSQRQAYLQRPPYPQITTTASAPTSASQSVFQSSSSLSSLSSVTTPATAYSAAQASPNMFSQYQTASAPLPSPSAQSQQMNYFAGAMSATQGGAPTSHPGHMSTAQQRIPQQYQQGQQAAYLGQRGNGGGAPETAPFLHDFNLVAEAAKRAQMACLARDLGDVGL